MNGAGTDQSLKYKIRRAFLSYSCIRWKCWRKWRTWLTISVISIYLLVLITILPLMIYGLYAVNAKPTFSAWFIAGIFTLFSIPIFLANLLQHLFNYTQPHLQAYIMRIIWIVPVYSIDSWLGLKFPDTAIYWSTVRECYESYALYNFLVYLLNFLETEYRLSELMDSRPPVRHPVPCCCCKPWPAGSRFIRWCKVAVLQYAILRPILTVIALITQLAGVYGEGDIALDKSYLYIALGNGISQGIALYGLGYFYKGLKDLLKPLKPVLKFAAIKIIIIVTFWQAVIVGILVQTNVIKQSEALDQFGFTDVAISIKDFLICIEMLIAAIAFYFIFSHRPFVDPAAAKVPCLHSFMEMIDVRDIYVDVREHIVDPIPLPIPLPRPSSSRRQPHQGKKKKQEKTTELIPLISDNDDNNDDDDERNGTGLRSLVIINERDYNGSRETTDDIADNEHITSESDSLFDSNEPQLRERTTQPQTQSTRISPVN